MATQLGRSINELNLGMLQLARESLLRDRLGGMAVLGIGDRVADMLLDMSVEELQRLAGTDVLLVGLRWQKPDVWQKLRQFASGKPAALPQAVVLSAREDVGGY